MVHITFLQCNIRPQLVNISNMKYFVLLVIVFTIFPCRECLKCYQCTHGQNSTLKIFGMLSECFFDEHDDVCEACYHCSRVIFDSNPESLTIMYNCDFNVTDMSYNANIKNCDSDLCNRETTILSTSILPIEYETTSPGTITNLENVTVTTTPVIESKSSASVIFSTSLSFFVLIMIFFV